MSNGNDYECKIDPRLRRHALLRQSRRGLGPHGLHMLGRPAHTAPTIDARRRHRETKAGSICPGFYRGGKFSHHGLGETSAGCEAFRKYNRRLLHRDGEARLPHEHRGSSGRHRDRSVSCLQAVARPIREKHARVGRHISERRTRPSTGFGGRDRNRGLRARLHTGRFWRSANWKDAHRIPLGPAAQKGATRSTPRSTNMASNIRPTT